MFLALLLPALAAPPANPPAAADLPALTGTWRLAEPRPTVQARVESALDAMLAPFNPVIRAFARPRIVTAATFCDTYQTTLTTTGFSVGCDGRASATAGFDQPAVAGTSPSGRAYSLIATWEGADVMFLFDSDEGGQQVRYRAEGGALIVEKTLLVDKLETKLPWEMKYVRQ
ncbi:MAG: hypothetical protein Q8P18_05945 [Pseudomonadota bacterium]|nr:hypothetical protein [Pseudomonadota bacterium]